MIALEHEADVCPAQGLPMLGFEPMDGLVEEGVLTGPCGVVHPEDVQQGRLPRPGRAHDGHEVALRDIDRNPS